jgi:hypothetical protein
LASRGDNGGRQDGGPLDLVLGELSRASAGDKHMAQTGAWAVEAGRRRSGRTGRSGMPFATAARTAPAWQSRWSARPLGGRRQRIVVCIPNHKYYIRCSIANSLPIIYKLLVVRFAFL